ncbi:MAG: malonic semialdehyde reductase [Pseudomonadota bacterium]|nr:malonic semialdehyde reductase [Pseudomonadota bacterium]
MGPSLDDAALDQLFRSARSIHTFKPEPVTDATVHALYDLLKWGPTAFNAQPARYVVIRSAAGKARLEPTLAAGNRDKTMAAPATVIVAYDTKFFERLQGQLPASSMELFSTNPAHAQSTAFRNGTLQGAYLLIAARALGLAVGPMSGFNAEALDREFFPDGRYRANFLVNIGYANDTAPRPRAPRFAFTDVVELI